MRVDSARFFSVPESASSERVTGRQAITVRECNDTMAFRDLREDWTGLLQESKANKLFLSWEWQYTWWETWASQLGLRLILLKAYRGDRLVGIAPLYVDNLRLCCGLVVRRIQFVGNAWGRAETVRTEYLEFITAREDAAGICSAFLDYLSGLRCWNEFVFRDLQKDSETCRQINKHASQYRWYTDIPDEDRGTRIMTSGAFKDYVQRLGRNTRLKLYNRRGYFRELGAVEHASASATELDDYFSILNAFHCKRWGKACFSGPSLDFHKALIKRLGTQQGYRLDCIKVDGNPVSVLYNLSAGGIVYNLQSGFIQDFDRKISLGTLHMGYAIEDSFNDPHCTEFDLLAGSGKREFYKSKYRGEIIDFVTLRVTRSHLLNLWYRAKRMLPVRVKHGLKKVRGRFRVGRN
jgi:CelD/BcsL family acetyltransferase involved in cellulose biosynthesis